MVLAHLQHHFGRVAKQQLEQRPRHSQPALGHVAGGELLAHARVLPAAPAVLPVRPRRPTAAAAAHLHFDSGRRGAPAHNSTHPKEVKARRACSATCATAAVAAPCAWPAWQRGPSTGTKAAPSTNTAQDSIVQHSASSPSHSTAQKAGWELLSLSWARTLRLRPVKEKEVDGRGDLPRTGPEDSAQPPSATLGASQGLGW
jgi:hypothetical protein